MLLFISLGPPRKNFYSFPKPATALFQLSFSQHRPIFTTTCSFSASLPELEYLLGKNLHISIIIYDAKFLGCKKNL